MTSFLVWGDDVLLYVRAEPGLQYEHWEGKMGWEPARSRAVAEESVLYRVQDAPKWYLDASGVWLKLNGEWEFGPRSNLRG